MSVVSRVQGFATDERGTIAVLWAMALVVFIGFAAAVVDVGQVAGEQGELQSFADEVALAAAGELDGQSDAITRANSAAATLVQGHQSFGSTGSGALGASDYTLTFYSALPTLDTAALTAVTTDPKKARYAGVVVTPQSVVLRFATGLARLLGVSNNTIAPMISANAVAGMTQEACDITPLMFCLPNAGFTADANIGKMIRLRAGGNGAAWGPGDFGFLDMDRYEDIGASCAGETGANLTKCLIAAAEGVTQCIRVDHGVDTEPGQKNGIENYAFNSRFDIYSNGSKFDTDIRFVPAPDVIKGIKPKGAACKWNNVQTTSNTLALPRDTCFATGTCGRYGDGVFNLNAYLDKNYGNGDGTLQSGEGSQLYTGITVDPNYSNGKTRYEVYLREIAYHNATGGNILTGRDETGLPSCHSASATPAGPERRVLIAAGVDCGANPISGRTSNVPVTEYFRIFMTEPAAQDASSPPRVDIWGEVIGSAGKAGQTSAGAGGIFRDIVQLYR